MNGEKIHAIGVFSFDKRTKDILDRIAALPSLAFRAVCLPDLHLKDRTEAPSSFAAATRGTIVPELTAPSVGCGMGLLATSLVRAEIDHSFYEKFYAAMRSNLGPRYGHFKNLLLWLGVINRPKNEYDLSREEFERLIKKGAPFAIEKYKLPQETLDHIEYHGSMLSADEQEKLNLKKILPRVSYRSGRHDLGYGFKGNHFLEIQYVEEILDETKAKEWGLKKDQVVIMYHGGGGAVSYHIGRYFANRKKNTFRQKIVLNILKFLFHFGALRDWKDFPKRFRYYFLPHPFMEIPLDSHEGQRLFTATKASLNYSYGFRVAMIRRILESLKAASPAQSVDGALVWDSIHNSIVEETIRGERVLVHRHTANRVFEGKPVFISGFNTTNSYLAVGMAHTEENLFSADHGAGVTIKSFEKESKVAAHPNNYVTHIYQTRSPFKRVVEHSTNEGVDYVVEKLEEEKILRPVVCLRPLAVFKG